MLILVNIVSQTSARGREKKNFNHLPQSLHLKPRNQGLQMFGDLLPSQWLSHSETSGLPPSGTAIYLTSVLHNSNNISLMSTNQEFTFSSSMPNHTWEKVILSSIFQLIFIIHVCTHWSSHTLFHFSDSLKYFSKESHNKKGKQCEVNFRISKPEETRKTIQCKLFIWQIFKMKS